MSKLGAGKEGEAGPQEAGNFLKIPGSRCRLVIEDLQTLFIEGLHSAFRARIVSVFSIEQGILTHRLSESGSFAQRMRLIMSCRKLELGSRCRQSIFRLYYTKRRKIEGGTGRVPEGQI